MASQKPDLWVNSLINRFEEQLPVKTGVQSGQTRSTLDLHKDCLIKVSRHKSKFTIVVYGLTKMLQNINSITRVIGEEAERTLYESQIIVLDTLEECLANATPSGSSRLEEVKYIGALLPEISQFFCIQGDNPLILQLKLSAAKALFAMSTNNFPAVFAKITARLGAIADGPDEIDQVWVASCCY